MVAGSVLLMRRRDQSTGKGRSGGCDARRAHLDEAVDHGVGLIRHLDLEIVPATDSLSRDQLRAQRSEALDIGVPGPRAHIQERRLAARRGGCAVVHEQVREGGDHDVLRVARHGLSHARLVARVKVRAGELVGHLVHHLRVGRGLDAGEHAAKAIQQRRWRHDERLEDDHGRRELGVTRADLERDRAPML